MPNGLQNGDIHDTVNALLVSGKIEYSLTYSRAEETLSIKVIQVLDVKLPDALSLVSPYVKIQTYKSPKPFFSFRDSESDRAMPNMEKEMKTKLRRPSETLTYNETFKTHIDADSLKLFTVCFVLCDMDKLSRHVTLGETSILLRKAKLADGQEKTFSEEFHEPLKVNSIQELEFHSEDIFIPNNINTYVFFLLSTA